MSIGAICGAIVAIIGLITSIYKAFIDPVRKAKKKAVEDGKQAVTDGDTSVITNTFDRVRR